MSQLSTSALLAKVDLMITTNGIEDITGAELNELLHDIGDSFYNKTDTSLATLDNLSDGDIPYLTSGGFYGSPISASASSIMFKSAKTLTTWALKALLTFGASGDEFNFTTDNGSGSESGLNITPTSTRLFAQASQEHLSMGGGISELTAATRNDFISPLNKFVGDILMDGSAGYARSIYYDIGSTRLAVNFGDDSYFTFYNSSTGQWLNGMEVSPYSTMIVTTDVVNSYTSSVLVRSDDIVARGTKSTFSGIEYDSDYSANYSLRSLVDKGFSDGRYLKNTGGTVSGPILYSGTPSADAELVNRAYVWDLVNGIDYKDNVAAATTANITLSGIQTIDGVSGSDGLRILVKDQTDQTENGIYIMRSGAWERSGDGDTGIKLEWAVVPISGGTQVGDIYRCNLNNITLGTDNIIWSVWSAGTYYAGSYLSLSGSTFNIDFTTFTTDQITEGSSNLYYTNSRSRSAISATGALSYNSSTGVLSLAQASSSVDGYLSSSDYTSFSNKNLLSNSCVGYGDGSGILTGTSDFTYDSSLQSLMIGTDLISLRAFTTTPTYGALYLTQSTINGSTYTIYSNGPNTFLNSSSTAGYISFRNSGGEIARFNRTYFLFSPLSISSGYNIAFSFVSPSTTNQTAGSEVPSFVINLTNGIGHSSNTLIPTNRDVWIKPSTHSFSSAGGIITSGYTMYIDGNPIAGTNCTITRSWALGVNGNFHVISQSLFGSSGISPLATMDISTISNGAHLMLRSNASASSTDDGAIWFDGTNLKMRVGGVTKTFTLT